MKIKKKENYTLILPDETTFGIFKQSFTKEIEALPKENIVTSFLDSFKPNADEINSFLDIAIHKKENGTSFVLVIDNISIDDFPEELNITPTIVEAEDIIEMENIERELGF